MVKSFLSVFVVITDVKTRRRTSVQQDSSSQVTADRNEVKRKVLSVINGTNINTNISSAVGDVYVTCTPTCPPHRQDQLRGTASPHFFLQTVNLFHFHTNMKQLHDSQLIRLVQKHEDKNSRRSAVCVHPASCS